MTPYSNLASTTYESQDDLIIDNIDLVKRIAHHLAARLPPSVDIDDLTQVGMIGLLEAANNFDSSKGASFHTYAGIRIRGAMLDEVRKLNWTPRSVYQKYRQVSDMTRSIEAKQGRPAEGREVAAELGISLDEYHAILTDTVGCRLFSLEETLEGSSQERNVPGSDSLTPEQELNQSQFRKELADAILKLPERERMVLSLYYERELNLKEIGKVLGVSESRVCQINGQALIRLRSMIDE